MEDIDGGSLSFKSVLDNKQINAAVEETLRRIQGLSDGTVTGSLKMDAAFDTTADGIRNALGQIGAACEMHENELQQLEAKYQELGQKASIAFRAGRDEEYRAITEQQNAVKGEITVRERLLQELRNQSNELEKVSQKQEENNKKALESSNAQVSMRTRIRELKEEMMMLVDQGIDEQSEAYQRLKIELGRLTDIQNDVMQQGKTLANDQQKFQGIISGLSGLAGGFSAVTGAVSMFAGENEDLQKVMTKVQSVMAITIGMQQVSQTLNKDSAFQLVTLNSLKTWWRNIVIKATAAETAETIATAANTIVKQANAAATGESAAAETLDTAGKAANTVAATTGTAANLTLAGAFRAVGLAIKSIPVFGWIIAGVGALAAAVGLLTSKQRNARKEQKEFNKEIVEGAYKPIGSIEQLSAKYASLGNDLNVKKKFVVDNKKAFEELGIAVNDVADAENLLIKNKETFIDAQIAKAKALALTGSKEYKKLLEESIRSQLKIEEETTKYKEKTGKEPIIKESTEGTYEVVEGNRGLRKAYDKLNESNKELKKQLTQSIMYWDEYEKNIKKIGGQTNEEIKGTIDWYDRMISESQSALNKTLPGTEQFEKIKKDLDNFKNERDKILGEVYPQSKGQGKGTKDLFLEKLETYKKEYTRFNKWINSEDEIISKAANTEFQGLLREGASYIDFLKNQRNIILSIGIESRTKEQNEQLRVLNDQIAEETKKTVLESFNAELSNQLNNAKSALEILNIIDKKRKELTGDETELDKKKKEALDEAEKRAIDQIEEDYKKSLEAYEIYQFEKLSEDQRYLKQKAELEKQYTETTDPVQKKVIKTQLDTLNLKRNLQQEQNYDVLLEQYKNYQQRIADISADYDAKIALATKNNNIELIAELQKAREAALGSEAMKEIENSDTYTQLFSNLDNLTVSKMIELRDKLEAEWTKLKLSPKELEALRNKINEINETIQTKNPFAALGDAIKRYNLAVDETAKKDALSDVFKGITASINIVKATFDLVINGLNEMGIASDEESQQVLDDISGIMNGASSLAMGIATENPLQIIQGSIDLITNGIDLIAGSKDRELNRSIKEHQKNIKELQKQYEELERAVDEALGSEKYKETKNELNNLKAQQAELIAMSKAEREKKKSDQTKIEEYEDSITDNAIKMYEIIDNLREDIIGGTASSIANDLGNAFVDAFAAGENAVDEFNDKVDDVVSNIMRKMLIQKLLEQPIGAIMDKYTKKWIDDSGNFMGFDAIISSAGAMGEELKGVGSAFAAAMELLPDDIKKYFTEETENKESPSSLSGAIKGISEETASIISGQVNAMRINQLEATDLLRQQLMSLSIIANNTSYNYHLTKLDRIVSLLEAQSSNSLRSKGLV
ncbi:MAG: Chromosome partition protein Smc [Ignavibacteria bacterium ADurb.Bin266]|nr:MAG: Chromosome partition protein Smc [Ignavibacteria bacterium ADurb.Bin266]